MPLKAVVASLDDVDTLVKEYYVEKDGKFFLDVEASEGFVLDNPEPLKRALSSERTLKKEFEKKATDAEKRLERYAGLDPDKYTEALSKVEDLEKKLVEKAGGNQDVDKIVEERVKTFQESLKTNFNEQLKTVQTTVSEKDKLLSEMTGRLREEHVANQIRSALQKVNPVEDAQDVIEVLVQRAVKVNDKPGFQFEVEVLDERGNPRLKNSGDPMTIADFILELKERRPALFKAENKSGMDVNPGGTGGRQSGVANPWKRGETWNITKQMQIENTDKTLAARLKAEAGIKV